MKEINLAVIGGGRISWNCHVGNLLRIAGCRMVALAGRSLAVAEAINQAMESGGLVEIKPFDQ